MIEKKTSTRCSHEPEVGVKCSVIRGLSQPGLDFGMLVGPVVVADHVQLTSWVGAGDLLQEVSELLVAVPVIARVGHLPRGDLERAERGGGAVADVVVGGPLGEAMAKGQDRRGSIEGLDLALLVHAQHDGLPERAASTSASIPPAR